MIRIMEEDRELAAFTTAEVVRIDVVFSYGSRRWVLEGHEWHVVDEVEAEDRS